MDEVNRVYEELIERGYFTDDELSLITCINGYSVER
jgi:transcription initiation factor IIE alpha subunit